MKKSVMKRCCTILLCTLSFKNSFEFKIILFQNDIILLRPPLIRKAVFKTYGGLFLLYGIWKIIWGISLWLGAYWLLKQTISYVRAKSTDVVTGQMYALGFFLSSIVASIAIHQLLSKSGRLGLRVCCYFHNYSN